MIGRYVYVAFLLAPCQIYDAVSGITYGARHYDLNNFHGVNVISEDKFFVQNFKLALMKICLTTSAALNTTGSNFTNWTARHSVCTWRYYQTYCIVFTPFAPLLFLNVVTNLDIRFFRIYNHGWKAPPRCCQRGPYLWR